MQVSVTGQLKMNAACLELRIGALALPCICKLAGDQVNWSMHENRLKRAHNHVKIGGSDVDRLSIPAQQALSSSEDSHTALLSLHSQSSFWCSVHAMPLLATHSQDEAGGLCCDLYNTVQHQTDHMLPVIGRDFEPSVSSKPGKW